MTVGTSSVEYRIYLEKPWNMRSDLVNITGSQPSYGPLANRFVSITNILKI
jgi:hypothetical protein